MNFYGFEQGIPEELTNIGGRVAITDQQSKQGECSLLWEFEEGNQLVFDAPIDYRAHFVVENDYRIYTFAAYLFGFGTEGRLRVGFWKEGAEQAFFEIRLGFEGWRSVMIYFDRDMQGTPTDGMDRMVITAQAGGKLLIDELIPANRYDQRYVLKSYQMPDVQEFRPMNVIDWQLRKDCLGAQLSLQEEAIIRKRCLQYLYEEYVEGKCPELTALEERMNRLAIREGSMGLHGMKVEAPNQRRVTEGTEGASDTWVSIRFATDLLKDLAVRFRAKGCERSKEWYLTVLRYLIQQGLAEGSTLGTHCILDYHMRPFYLSVMLMHEELAAEGLLAQLCGTMRWFQHLANLGFAEGIPGKKASSDDFYNSAQGMLFMILLLEDRAEKAAYLRAYQLWLDRNMALGEGLDGIFKEDGCIYHHHGHYIAYGETGLFGLVPIVYMLTGTSFAVSDSSWQNVKRVLESIWFQCWGGRVPVVFSGRHPLGIARLLRAPYKYYELICELRGEPMDYAKSGSRSFPMACAQVHRRPGWLAAAKGFSRYLWGSEIYKGNNHYGRYRSYGVLELFGGEEGETTVFSHDGFDWNRFPGATTIHLPMEELEARIYNVDQFCGFEEDLFSDQSFAGGMSLGDNGMFSMILTEHPKYNGTHKAYKSVFFHDDFILLLGSGITNDSAYETETTLFQDTLAAAGGVLLNGEVFAGQRVIREGDVLTDTLGNHYYLKAGTGIYAQNGEQISQSSTGTGETRGSFATAVIRHGSAPQEASYEYGIGMKGAAAPAYQVLRQDETAHVVRIGSTVYYAIFEPEHFEEIRTDVPLMVMIEEQENGLRVAVCDPDLGLYEEDPDQYDENGIRKEVSIYSRSWIIHTTPVRERQVRLQSDAYSLDLTLRLRGGFGQQLFAEKR